MRIGIGKIREIPGPPPPPVDPAIAVINDGHTVGWYLADDLTTITKDGGNLVSQWNDKLASGHNLLQANGAKQPLWVSPDYIQFDGIDNFMKCAAFTLIQPEFIYMIVKAITWTNLDYLFDGNATNYGRVRQDTATPGIIAGTNLTLPLCNDLTLNTWHILRCRFDGANSKIQIDANAEVTGDCGAGNMGGFTLGARGATDIRFANMQVKEIINRNIIEVFEDETYIYNYLVTRKP